MDRLFLRVVWLGEATQKHYRGGDVLIGLSKLWGIIPPVHGIALDPMVYAHRAQCGALSELAQSVAGAATVVVVPHRAPV